MSRVNTSSSSRNSQGNGSGFHSNSPIIAQTSFDFLSIKDLNIDNNSF